MICGRCGKTVRERVTADGWHELYGCDCAPRAWKIDPSDERKTIRREAAP